MIYDFRHRFYLIDPARSWQTVTVQRISLQGAYRFAGTLPNGRVVLEKPDVNPHPALIYIDQL